MVEHWHGSGWPLNGLPPVGSVYLCLSLEHCSNDPESLMCLGYIVML